MISYSPQYRLVYDAATAGYTDWWFPAAGVGLLLIFGTGLYFSIRQRRPRRRAWIFYIGVPALVIWTVVAVAGTYGDYASLRDRLRSGEFTLVEGMVQDLQSGDNGDHLPETWSVQSGGRLFKYSYVRSQLTPGFRYEAVHGGPIREGLRVRIADVDGHIARLEIADSVPPHRAPNER